MVQKFKVTDSAALKPEQARMLSQRRRNLPPEKYQKLLQQMQAGRRQNTLTDLQTFKRRLTTSRPKTPTPAPTPLGVATIELKSQLDRILEFDMFLRSQLLMGQGPNDQLTELISKMKPIAAEARLQIKQIAVKTSPNELDWARDIHKVKVTTIQEAEELIESSEKDLLTLIPAPVSSRREDVISATKANLNHILAERNDSIKLINKRFEKLQESNPGGSPDEMRELIRLEKEYLDGFYVYLQQQNQAFTDIQKVENFIAKSSIRSDETTAYRILVDGYFRE